MIFRNLDADGDWTFGQGIQNYVSGNEAIGLNIKTRLLSWLYDCFFDQFAGIDWLTRLGAKNQRNALELDLRRVILQSYGVTAINSFSSTLIGRAYVANYSINTIYSQNYIDSLQQNIGTPS